MSFCIPHAEVGCSVPNNVRIWQRNALLVDSGKAVIETDDVEQTVHVSQLCTAIATCETGTLNEYEY